MPLPNIFNRKKKKEGVASASPESFQQNKTEHNGNGQNRQPHALVFNTQLAHGSPTGRIDGFTNVRELYAKIAQTFSISVDEILFCTLNTHKCDMTRLLGGQIGLEDFIFAHVKGQRKSVTLTKSEPALGLTITDNGTGFAFIKRIKEGSTADANRNILVGDHIESIQNKNLIGSRHFEVAKTLKEIPLNTTFDIVLIEPRKAFDMISQRSAGPSKPTNISSGKATLRLRSKGPATVEDIPTEMEDKAVTRIDDLLESFMGIRDTELASTIFEAGKDCPNPDRFAGALEVQLGDFGFPEHFVYDVWGILSDMKRGTL